MHICITCTSGKKADSNSVVPGWSQRFYIYNKSSDDVHALQPILWLRRIQDILPTAAEDAKGEFIPTSGGQIKQAANVSQSEHHGEAKLFTQINREGLSTYKLHFAPGRGQTFRTIVSLATMDMQRSWHPRQRQGYGTPGTESQLGHNFPTISYYSHSFLSDQELKSEMKTHFISFMHTLYMGGSNYINFLMKSEDSVPLNCLKQ